MSFSVLFRERFKRFTYVYLALFARFSGIGWLIGIGRRGNGLIVLMYHKISDIPHNTIAVSIAQFEEQMAYLKEHFTVISMEEAIRHLREGYSFPERAVLITFDDGYKDNLTNAYPILKRYGCKAALFVPIDYPGQKTLPHDEFVEGSNPTLSWSEIADVQDVFEIGSHGCSHRTLTGMPVTEALAEIKKSKETLEEKIGKEIRSFSYPKGSIGDFNEALEEGVRSAGYQLCFTTIPGKNVGTFSPFRLRRYNVENFGLGYFKCLLEGSADILNFKDTRLGAALKSTGYKVLGLSEK